MHIQKLYVDSGILLAYVDSFKENRASSEEKMKIKIVSEEKIRTEKPIEELWLQLRLFGSEYYSKQFL